MILAREMERLFNVQPRKKEICIGQAETFKRNLDIWLKTVPYEPSIENYVKCN